MPSQGINALILFGLIVLYGLGAGAHAVSWPCTVDEDQIVVQKPWLFRIFYSVLAALIGSFCLVPLIQAEGTGHIGEVLLWLALAPFPLLLSCLWWAGPHTVRFERRQRRFSFRRGFPGLASTESVPLEDIATMLIVPPTRSGSVGTKSCKVIVHRKTSGRKLLWGQFSDQHAAQAVIERISELPGVALSI